MKPRPTYISRWTYRHGNETYVLLARGRNRRDINDTVTSWMLLTSHVVAPKGAKFVGREDFIVPSVPK